MASVYSESPGATVAQRRLSIALEGEASASPFPSPSSSFLPPPTPGAHEFAIKPPPSPHGRNANANTNGNGTGTGRKSSTPPTHISNHCEVEPTTESQRSPMNADGSSAISLPISSSQTLNEPLTPTPLSVQQEQERQRNLEVERLLPPRSPLPASSNSTTPTVFTFPLPPEEERATTATTSTETETETETEIVIPYTLPGANGPISPAFSSYSSSSRSRPISVSINTSNTTTPDLFSNRPAPPSPAVSSRRVSGAPSFSSTTTRSRPPSAVISRANSLRKSTTSKSARSGGGGSGSPVINPHRQSLGQQLSQLSEAPPPPSPQNLTFSLNVPPVSSSPFSYPSVSASSQPSAEAYASTSSAPASSSQTATTRVGSGAPPTATTAIICIKIRDFGFPPSDERHLGLGPEVPKPNRVRRLNRRLGGRTVSQGSLESSDGDEGVEEEEGWDEMGGGGGGWDGFRMGLGRLSWSSVGVGVAGTGMGGSTAASVLKEEEEKKKSGFPSRMELDRNFLEAGDEEEEEDEYYDAVAGVPMADNNNDDDDDYEEDALYPGLYRALYAFEPEGTAEMRLEEDQLVRVVGRGGGVGWAVVVDEKGTREEAEEAGRGSELVAPKHALVPESYLEAVRLDWEDQEAAAMTAAAAGL